ncbi:response regulator [Jeongeupia chitinilytica]|uniref:Response regulator n=1 Tax=Jeongeupia chitinilytica TaxID=1041641 RepID=A0ABQ3H462_9NEIS|nr:response regulator [Jeongeupia chitinilytica]GHD66629.1 response regulator [Jeongeupia chitinilytica]
MSQASRALVIEPASEARAMLARGLLEAGAGDVDYAARTGDAFTKLKQTPYDIVLCEYDLGQSFDGLHFFEACQTQQLLKPSCVFMIVTGERRLAQVMSAAELTPDAYLLKPFSSSDLLQRLARAIARKRQLRAIDDASRAGDYLAAIAACNAELSNATPAERPDLLRHKGRLLGLLGEHTMARDFYREQLADGDWPWAQMGLARSLFALKQYDEARLLFERVKTEHELVMDAYDGLARTLSAQGETEAAQVVLEQAVARSPLVARRQRARGRLAQRNGVLDVAQAALSQAVQLNRGSFWRDPALYGELARVQLAQGDIGAARRTAAQLMHDFRGDDVAQAVAEMIEGTTFIHSGEKDKARKLIAGAATRLAARDDAPAGALLEAAQACVALGDGGDAEKLVRRALSNRHDDAEIVAGVETLYADMGRPEAGAALIQEAARDIVELNNEAVRAAQEGDLRGAAERFIAALDRLPGNVGVLLNAANALLTCVNRMGWDAGYMQIAQTCVQRVMRIEPGNGRARQLQEVWLRTQRRFGIDAGHGSET